MMMHGLANVKFNDSVAGTEPSTETLGEGSESIGLADKK